MSNAIYPKYKEALLTAASDTELDGSGVTGVFAALVTSAYTYSAAHQYYSDLTGIVGTPQEIVSKTYTNGVFDGADVLYTTVAGGDTVTAIVLYVKNTGASSTWRLIAYMDSGVTGLPIATNGGNIAIAWNGSGIFSL